MINIAILYFLAPMFRLFHRVRMNPKNGQVVLIWYTGKLGDLVCLTGVMRAFKETRSGCHLVLIARAPFTDILSHNPNIDEIIPYRSDKYLSSWLWVVGVWKRLSKYPIQETHVLVESLEAAIGGLWFDARERHLLVTVNRRSTRMLLSKRYTLHPFPYTTRIKHWYLSEFARVEPSDVQYPNELVFPETNSEVDREWECAGMSQRAKVIGVLPSSGKDFKRWPEEYWKTLIQKFDALRYGIVLFGAGKDEEETIERLCSGIHSPSLKIVNAPLQTVPYFIRKCSLVVGVDTGLIYIADALGIPVVDIMGPVDEVNQRPERRYVLVNNNEACPRVLKTPPRSLVTRHDLESMNRCFESITVEQVFAACKEMLDKG